MLVSVRLRLRSVYLMYFIPDLLSARAMRSPPRSSSTNRSAPRSANRQPARSFAILLQLFVIHCYSALTSQLIDLFDTEDPREREYLKTILHRIYGEVVLVLRRAAQNVVHASCAMPRLFVPRQVHVIAFFHSESDWQCVLSLRL